MANAVEIVKSGTCGLSYVEAEGTSLARMR